jgi:hypothetical protein
VTLCHFDRASLFRDTCSIERDEIERLNCLPKLHSGPETKCLRSLTANKPEAGKPTMVKQFSALVLVALAVAYMSPVSAQSPQGTSVGTLTCKMAPSIGLVFGSRQRMACRFIPNGPSPPEAYVGVMKSIGLDIGITAGGAMAWCHSARCLTPYRRRSLTPASTCEALGPSTKNASRVGSTLEADGGQSSALIHKCVPLEGRFCHYKSPARTQRHAVTLTRCWVR